jgi:tRNA/tmRNA/rRNA uracil-C5-methylase (TrmA/RlmC/RlmD family)
VDPNGSPGYYRLGTQSVVSMTGCPLHVPCLDNVVAKAGEIGLGGVDSMVVRCGDDGETVANLTSSTLEELPAHLADLSADGLYFNHGHVRGVRWVNRCLGDMTFRVSPGTFFQVHSTMAQRLNEEVRRLISRESPSRIVDLYAGTGAMGMTLSDLAEEVVGVEVDRKTCEDATEAAHLNGAENYRQIEATAQAGLEILRQQGFQPSVVLLDPPRRGCEKGALLDLTTLAPKAIVYVSCNPATLARDLGILMTEGWETQDFVLLDLFPQTFHI